MRTSMIRTDSHRGGVACVELAVLLPFLLFICVITTDWARCLRTTLTAEACARNGALYLCDESIKAASPYPSVQQAALSECPELADTATVSTNYVVDSAGNQAVVVTVSVPFNTLANFPGVPSLSILSRSCQMRIAPMSTK